MTPDRLDPQLRDRGTQPGWIRFLWWPLSVALTFYMVVLPLICIDEFFMDHRLVLRPMQAYTPDLIEPLCQLCEAVYRPMTYFLHALQIAAQT